MQAYEFIAKPEGGAITIPDEYKHLITSSVRVIVLKVEQSSYGNTNDVARKSEMILPPSIDTRGWKFSREEANER